MLRRSLLAAPLLLAASPARAEWTPRRPIHVLVGTAPGGTADIAARLCGEAIQRYGDNSDRARVLLGEPRVYPYGSSAAETFDLYPCASAGAPLHVFIHGGAWQRLSKRESAFPAPAPARSPPPAHARSCHAAST